MRLRWHVQGWDATDSEPTDYRGPFRSRWGARRVARRNFMHAVIWRDHLYDDKEEAF